MLYTIKLGYLHNPGSLSSMTESLTRPPSLLMLYKKEALVIPTGFMWEAILVVKSFLFLFPCDLSILSGCILPACPQRCKLVQLQSFGILKLGAGCIIACANVCRWRSLSARPSLPGQAELSGFIFTSLLSLWLSQRDPVGQQVYLGDPPLSHGEVGEV